MVAKKLSIKKLSKNGELLSVIDCYSSQISVFRANSTSELRPYQRALAGIPGPEKFSIVIDSEPFSPDDHYLIGFGERFSAGHDDYTAAEFLARHGVSDEAITSALYSLGLDEAKKTPCSSLTPCEERRLRILAAGFTEPSQLIILDDPFSPIAGQWRERVAETLVELAKTGQRLIVVTSLSHRPDCWIDNERIARIQVGQDLQKTIGFGTKNEELASALEEVRRVNSSAISLDSMKPEGLSASAEQPAPASHSQSFQQNFGKLPAQYEFDLRKIALMTGILAVLGIVGIKAGFELIPLLSGRDVGSDVATHLPTNSLSSVALSLSSAETTEVSSSALSQDLTTQDPISAVSSEAAPLPPAIHTTFLLDKYPSSIKESIIDGFEGLAREGAAQPRSPRISILSDEISQTRSSASPAKVDQKTQTAKDILSVLESTSNTGESSPRFQNDEAIASESMSPEQRREIIRQRFLEAIQRASKQ